jgi:hypothetical protein
MMFVLIFIQFCFISIHASCYLNNYCNGHGKCNKESKCECYNGWGSTSDITSYRAPDCSARTCPSGVSWGDLALSTTDAHRVAECSDGGICDRKTGRCKCFDRFTGSSCERSKCLNDCSGHGLCMSMERLAQKTSYFPFSAYTTYDNVKFLK